MPANRRAFIVDNELPFGMMRLYGAHQEGRNQDVPEIVRSLEEALASLHAEGATFEPV